MTPTKQESIRRLERMLAREESRSARIIIAFLLMAVGAAYFVVTSYVCRVMPPAAISEMYVKVPLCFFTPAFLYLKGSTFLACGVVLLVRTFDKSREVMLTALLEILRFDANRAGRRNDTREGQELEKTSGEFTIRDG